MRIDQSGWRTSQAGARGRHETNFRWSTVWSGSRRKNCLPSLQPEIVVVCILLDMSIWHWEEMRDPLVVERRQSFLVVSRYHPHCSRSLGLGHCKNLESQKCGRGYSVLFDFYHIDLNSSPSYLKERLRDPSDSSRYYRGYGNRRKASDLLVKSKNVIKFKSENIVLQRQVL